MATHSSVLAWRIPGPGSLVGCRLWGCTESDTTEVLSSSSSILWKEWQILFSWGPKITEDHDCSYEIKRCLFLGRKAMTNLYCSVAQLYPIFATPWSAAHQVSLSITNSRSLLKLMSIKSVMPSNHLILCHPLFLLPSIFPSIGVFSNESALHIRWPKY